MSALETRAARGARHAVLTVALDPSAAIHISGRGSSPAHARDSGVYLQARGCVRMAVAPAVGRPERAPATNPGDGAVPGAVAADTSLVYLLRQWPRGRSARCVMHERVACMSRCGQRIASVAAASRWFPAPVRSKTPASIGIARSAADAGSFAGSRSARSRCRPCAHTDSRCSGPRRSRIRIPKNTGHGPTACPRPSRPRRRRSTSRATASSPSPALPRRS